MSRYIQGAQLADNQPIISNIRVTNRFTVTALPPWMWQVHLRLCMPPPMHSAVAKYMHITVVAASLRKLHQHQYLSLVLSYITAAAAIAGAGAAAITVANICLLGSNALQLPRCRLPVVDPPLPLPHLQVPKTLVLHLLFIM
jgi:hypothetical protein